MKHIIIFVFAVFLSGCASSIMKSYIGKDINEAVLDYGMYKNTIDLPDGIRAFQWQFNSTYTTPATINSQGNVYAYGNSGTYNSTSTYTPSQTYSSNCAYTLLAKKNGERWIVIDYRKPRFMCE